MKAQHEALKKQGRARQRKRAREKAEQNEARPAYERQSHARAKNRHLRRALVLTGHVPDDVVGDPPQERALEVI